MQSSPSQAPSNAGELIASFRHGKAFLVVSLIFGTVMLALAGFVLYLSTILPPGNDGPVSLQTSRGMTLNFSDPHMVFYATSVLLAVIGLSMFAVYVWHKKLRELHVRARLPAVAATLEAGGAVTFNCISSAQVWGKRVTGNFLKITTTPILVSATFLEYQGRKVPMASLRTVDLNAWTENVVIKDENGKPVLSTIATGILSHDLFLNSLDVLFAVEEQRRELA